MCGRARAGDAYLRFLKRENDEVCRPRAENLVFPRHLAGENDEK
jgi:hypothetical protein